MNHNLLFNKRKIPTVEAAFGVNLIKQKWDEPLADGNANFA